MKYSKLDVSDIMAKYHYTEAEAKAFIWGVKQSAAPRMAELLQRLVDAGWNASISEDAKEILNTVRRKKTNDKNK